MLQKPSKTEVHVHSLKLSYEAFLILSALMIEIPVYTHSVLSYFTNRFYFKPKEFRNSLDTRKLVQTLSELNSANF